MAISSLLLSSTLPLSKPKIKHLPTCHLNPNPNLRLSQNYHLSWKDELKLTLTTTGYDSVSIKDIERKLEDDDFFWDSVDRRCVDNIRMLIVDSVQNAGAGHTGMALGMAEVGYLLFRHVMRYNPMNPRWLNRDRFVLSAGHGCLLLYVCLHLAGFHSVQVDDLKRLCKLGSWTPEHPENIVTEGVEVTTGPLGQGVANAVGLALKESRLASHFNKSDMFIIDHRTYCIMGDGCAMEGISNEAAALAAHLKLHKLTLIYDDNHNTIVGDMKLAFSEDISAHFEALGWNTVTVENIHEDMNGFRDAILAAHKEKKKPTFIRVKTLIGRLSKKEGTSKAHHGTFDNDDVNSIRKKVNWEHREPFHVIPMVYREFAHQAEYGESLEKDWNSTLRRYVKKYPCEAEELSILLNGGLPPGWENSLPVTMKYSSLLRYHQITRMRCILLLLILFSRFSIRVGPLPMRLMQHEVTLRCASTNWQVFSQA